MNTTNSNQHIPVLLERVLDVLQPTEGESYLDLTSGYGGHARAIIEKTGKQIADGQHIGEVRLVLPVQEAGERMRSSGEAALWTVHDDWAPLRPFRAPEAAGFLGLGVWLAADLLLALFAASSIPASSTVASPTRRASSGTPPAHSWFSPASSPSSHEGERYLPGQTRDVTVSG